MKEIQVTHFDYWKIPLLNVWRLSQIYRQKKVTTTYQSGKVIKEYFLQVYNK